MFVLSGKVIEEWMGSDKVGEEKVEVIDWGGDLGF